MTDIKCLKCKNNETGICNRCDMYYDEFDPIETPPITNADRIRAMTDEELAEYLSGIAECNRGCRLDCGDSCIGAWLDWLKSEA